MSKISWDTEDKNLRNSEPSIVFENVDPCFSVRNLQKKKCLSKIVSAYVI